MTTRRASTVPDAEDALLALLDARAGLDGVLVTYGLPTEEPAARERLYLVGMENNTRTLIVQQGARTERYILPIVLEVHFIGGVDQRRPVRDRAWAIIEEVEDALADNPELAATVDEARLDDIPSVNVVPSAEGWLARGILNVGVEATI